MTTLPSLSLHSLAINLVPRIAGWFMPSKPFISLAKIFLPMKGNQLRFIFSKSRQGSGVIMNESRIFSLLCVFGMAVSVCHARDYVIVVDTSGSMLYYAKGPNKLAPLGQRRIDVVKPILMQGLQDLPQDTRLSLIEFNTGIKSTQFYDFSRADDRKQALAWVQALNPPPTGDTHLWGALRTALMEARGYLKRHKTEHREDSVVVRIYTDGDNDDKSAETGNRSPIPLTPMQVLGDFPEVDGKQLRPSFVLMGSDFEMELVMKDPKQPGITQPQRDGRELKKLQAEDKVDITRPKEMFDIILPWHVVRLPRQPVEGQEMDFTVMCRSVFSAYDWSVDGNPVNGREEMQLPQGLPAGHHSVSVRVTHSSGQESATESFTVNASEPSAAFAVEPRSAFTLGDVLTFRSLQDKHGWSHQWFVNGNPLPATSSIVKWTGVIEGEVKVDHHVASESGLGDDTKVVFGSKMPSPETAFEVLPDVVCKPGAKLTFRAKQPKPDCKHDWLLDNGIRLEGVEVSWKAEKPGRVKVTHRVTSPSGTVDSPAQVIVCEAMDLPDAGFEVPGGRDFIIGETLQLQPKVTRPGWKHSWTIGGVQSEGAEISWPSNLSGEVKVIHRVTSGAGTQEAVQTLNGVLVRVTAKPTSGNFPLRVEYKDETQPAALVRDRVWKFADGELEPGGAAVSHVFTEPGKTRGGLAQITTARGQVIAVSKLGEHQPWVDINVTKPWPWWWKWLAVGIVAAASAWKLVSKYRGRPMYGNLKWICGTTEGDAPLGGKRILKLTTLTRAKVAGWKPRHEYRVHNKGGTGAFLISGGSFPIVLKKNQTVNLDGLMVTWV